MENKILEIQKKYGVILAKKAFETGAIKLSPQEPFTWASGYRMPIYNDNRRFLAFPEMRATIAEAFETLAKCLDFKPEWIAGVATGGIPHSATLADRMSLPCSYIRSSEKGHGLKNQIEGLGPHADFKGANVLVIEDLFSTGGSSIKAIEAVRSANGSTPYCFAIFSYGLDKATTAFAELKPSCKPITILNYDIMLKTALAENYISGSAEKTLVEWRKDPFGWGEKNGFQKV